MKHHQVSEQFILEAHKASCKDWKQKIEAKFPEVFKDKIQAGKWYKTTDLTKKTLIFITNPELGNDCGFGFNYQGDWTEKANLSSDWECEAASGDEVLNALSLEANKRGFVQGAVFTSKYINTKYTFSGEFKLQLETNLLGVSESGRCYTIFEKGYWAEIITPVVEDDSSNVTEEEEVVPTPDEIDRVLNYLKEKAKQ